MKITNVPVEQIPISNYGEWVVEYIRKKYIYYKTLQSVLYVLVYSCATATSVLAAIVLSKLHISADRVHLEETPDWYYISAGLISAISSLISGMLNFFLVKEKVRTYQVMKNNIFLEIIKYKTQMTPEYRSEHRDYNHFIKVNIILGSTYAKREVIYA